MLVGQVESDRHDGHPIPKGKKRVERKKGGVLDREKREERGNTAVHHPYNSSLHLLPSPRGRQLHQFHLAALYGY